MRANLQRVLHCPCGLGKVLALGMCATCHTMKRQAEGYLGGLHEAVLERDRYRCRVCDASGRDKRSTILHHRVPGKSTLNLIVPLPSLPCQASPEESCSFGSASLLLELWREQHPKGHEQDQLNVAVSKPLATPVELFGNERETCL